MVNARTKFEWPSMTAVKRLGAVLLFAAGCAGGASEPASPGNAALGITEFQVTEGPKQLRITGLDREHALVGELLLAIGPVAKLDGQGTADGRTLSLSFKGSQAEHSSEGFNPLVLPLVSDRGLNAFLADAHVATPLKKWGIAISTAAMAPTPAAPAQEQPYGACTVSPALNASCGCQNSCVVGDGHQYVCCGSSQTAVYRLCTIANSTNDCGPTGPGGCAVCWSIPYNGQTCDTTYATGPSCTLTLTSGGGVPPGGSGGAGFCVSNSDCGGAACCNGTCTTYFVCP